jgi:uncharacterized membrane protein
MSWFLGIVGFFAGLYLGFANDLPPLECGVALAVALFVLTRIALRDKPAAGSGSGAAATQRPQRMPAMPAASVPADAPLSDRVLRLEREVAMLRNEVMRLRGDAVAPDQPAFDAPAAQPASAAGGSPEIFTQTQPSSLPASGPPRPYTLSDAEQEEMASEHAHPSAPFGQPAGATVVAAAQSDDSGTAAASDAGNALNANAADAASATTAAKPATPAREPVDFLPRGPGPIERAIKAGRDWLLGGNTVVRVGIIVLFFGIAFLLKYAADNSMFPVELRLAAVALAATVLLGLGWRLRDRRHAYGLVLQGGGVGILYLTVFAATKLYHLLPGAAAFPLMVAICVLSALLAIRQNAPTLAFMGSAGGFLAPVLLATGGGSHVMLFSYYTLLNAGIFAIAWFKAWRPLNLLGFVFTFGIAAAWGAKAYQPELFSTTEPFLLLFFLMYVGISLLYAARREIALRHYVDGTLVFGTPLVATLLQGALVHNIEFGMAWSAVALSAFYLCVATWLRSRRARLGLLFDAMLALAVIFATLAVPLAFTGPTTSAVWAVEGAAIVWVSQRQRRLVALLFALALQLAAGAAFFLAVSDTHDPSALPILNGAYIGSLLIALAGLCSGWRLHGKAATRQWHPWLAQVGIAVSIWGLLWWTAGGVNEIFEYVGRHDDSVSTMKYTLEALVLFGVFSAWLAHGARRALNWQLPGWAALLLTPFLAVISITLGQGGAAPLTGLYAMPVAIVLGYVLLWRQQAYMTDRVLKPLHTLLFWTLCWLLALEGYWRIAEYVPEGAWSWSAWAYGFGVVLLLLATLGARLRWPVLRFPAAYMVWGAAPLAVLLWGWSIASVMSDGDASPLFYLPILNPLDIAQLLALVAVASWLRRLTAMGVKWRYRAVEYAALATIFLWFNALLLRTLHHRFGSAYDIDAVLFSFTNQQVFLLGSSVFAFLGMWLARRDSLVRLFAVASTPVVIVMWLWTFAANFTQDGGSWARLPLLNPLDLVQLAIFALAGFWLLRIQRLGVPVARYGALLRVLAGITGFVWLNTMLLRTLHHWAGIPYTLDDLSQSTLVQASVSVFWTVCALATMILATRRAARLLWFTGAGLLALTVVKLFLFDLSHLGGIARIVSFIGIGIMLLLIGYFSPLPPKRPAVAAPGAGPTDASSRAGI